MSHYQLLYSYMNMMIEENPIIQIYTLFNVEEQYSHILPNWEEQSYTSSLIGEIYSFHYWLKTYNVNDDETEQTSCRISKYFFSNKAGTEQTS